MPTPAGTAAPPRCARTDDVVVRTVRLSRRQAPAGKKNRWGFLKKPPVDDVLLANAELGDPLETHKLARWRVLGRGFEDFSWCSRSTSS